MESGGLVGWDGHVIVRYKGLPNSTSERCNAGRCHETCAGRFWAYADLILDGGTVNCIYRREADANYVARPVFEARRVTRATERDK
jgi:hypothetical protein